MNFILLKNYKKEMGIFINFSSSTIFDNELNVSFDDLIVNYKELLDKNKKYYLFCNGGIQSRKAYNTLKYKGYDVVLVLK